MASLIYGVFLSALIIGAWAFVASAIRYGTRDRRK